MKWRKTGLDAKMFHDYTLLLSCFVIIRAGEIFNMRCFVQVSNFFCVIYVFTCH